MDQKKTDSLRHYFVSKLMQLADNISRKPDLFTSEYFIKTLDVLRNEYMKQYNVGLESGDHSIDVYKKRNSYYGILPRKEGKKLREQTRGIRAEWD